VAPRSRRGLTLREGVADKEAEMAYRYRQIVTIKYGHFGEYLSTVKRIESIAKAKGWAPVRVLVPTAGLSNEVVLENEYPDLATFQSEGEAFYADADAFQAFRDGAEFIVEGSARTELLEDVPMDFPGSD
jgi:hypothetical protein